jgi:thioredoxin-like negative regulator of GroEL
LWIPRSRVGLRWAAPTFAFAILGLAVAVPASDATQASESYAEAYQLASKTGRPMVVFVGADWCGPCQRMKREVIPQVRRRGLLGRVAFAMVNVDGEPKLGRSLRRGGPIPQLLMFRRTPKGWRLSRLTGGQSVPNVEAFIDHGLQRDAETKAETVQASHVQTSQTEPSEVPSESAPATADDAAD